MKRRLSILSICCFVCSFSLHSQTFNLDKNKFAAVNSSMSIEKFMGKDVVKVIKDPAVTEFDAPTFAKLNGIEFKNGTIEVEVLSRLLSNAPESARGFIGVAFRINDSNSKFECIYIRPTNGRASDQLRRNHSTQYFSFPDYKFERLRKEAPGVYESYADIGLNEWIKLRIVVKESHADFFVNDSKQPSLVVNDLKHGDNAPGAIGLWVDVGTEGFFSDLRIQKEK